TQCRAISQIKCGVANTCGDENHRQHVGLVLRGMQNVCDQYGRRKKWKCFESIEMRGVRSRSKAFRPSQPGARVSIVIPLAAKLGYPNRYIRKQAGN